MIFKTISPKVKAVSNHYLGMPVRDANGYRIGSIIDVIDQGDHFELIMDIEVEVNWRQSKFSFEIAGKDDQKCKL